MEAVILYKKTQATELGFVHNAVGSRHESRAKGLPGMLTLKIPKNMNINTQPTMMRATMPYGIQWISHNIALSLNTACVTTRPIGLEALDIIASVFARIKAPSRRHQPAAQGRGQKKACEP